MKYDVIVVGAGPAGSTAGYLLSKFGFNVLMIDKSYFPRSKLCGGGLTFKTYKLVERIFDLSEADFKKLINFSSRDFKIFYKDKLLLEGNSDKSFYFVERDKYDFFFMKRAKQQGANIIEGEKVIDFNPSSNTVVTSSGKRYDAKFIIGADGVNSIIRRKLPIFEQEKWRKNLAIALEIFIKNFKVEEPWIYLGFVNAGYGWIFPNKDKTVIGLGGLLEKNKNFDNKFKNFLHQLELKDDYDVRGHLIPGDFIERPVYKNVILVGDAAGFTDPLLGEGIFYAHRSGEIAAWSIYYNLNEGKDLESTYIKLLEKYLFPQLKYGRKIRDKVFKLLSSFRYLPLKLISKLLQKYSLDMLNIVHGIKLYNLKKWKGCYEPIRL